METVAVKNDWEEHEQKYVAIPKNINFRRKPI